MNAVLTILHFVLSLFGLDAGTSTFVDRGSRDGATTLESRAEVRAGVARFECVRSASGRCHYTVMPAECSRSARRAPWPASRCPGGPLQRFSVGAGQSRQQAGLARFELCVSTEAQVAGGDCRPVEPIASR